MVQPLTFGTDREFHAPLYWARIYLSMLGFKLKRTPDLVRLTSPLTVNKLSLLMRGMKIKSLAKIVFEWISSIHVCLYLCLLPSTAPRCENLEVTPVADAGTFTMLFWAPEERVPQVFRKHQWWYYLKYKMDLPPSLLCQDILKFTVKNLLSHVVIHRDVPRIMCTHAHTYGKCNRGTWQVQSYHLIQFELVKLVTDSPASQE